MYGHNFHYNKNTPKLSSIKNKDSTNILEKVLKYKNVIIQKAGVKCSY